MVPDSMHKVPVILDVHQHLWPEGLLARLSARTRGPRIDRTDPGERWVLSLDGELPGSFDLADHDPEARAALVVSDGLDHALIVPPIAFGIESLPPDEAEHLLDAYHEGVLELPACFSAWAAARLVDPDPEKLAETLDRGFIGLALPAGALTTPSGWERCAPLLEVAEGRDLPLFIHPGQSPWELDPAPGPGEPDWFPAMTRYIAQMQSAWYALAISGRAQHPRLRVVFALLAGLAPVHIERLAMRQGYDPLDRLAYLETSSYGNRALDAVLRVVGVDNVVYGSDRPIVPGVAPKQDALGTLLLTTNPERLFPSFLTAAPKEAR